MKIAELEIAGGELHIYSKDASLVSGQHIDIWREAPYYMFVKTSCISQQGKYYIIRDGEYAAPKGYDTIEQVESIVERMVEALP